jgi:heptosyltransferase-2
MKIFIETPTWLGDSVMTTPSIENIIKNYPNAKITIFGSSAATAIFNFHPNVEKIIVDDSKKYKNRLKRLRFLIKNLDGFDYALSFRGSFFSKILLFFINSSHKSQYIKNKKITKHQVLRYKFLVNNLFNLNDKVGDLKIYTKNQITKKNILGINPGATYGSAKRWYADKFAEVVNAVATGFDEVVIFGGSGEADIAGDIVKDLKITNYTNLAGKLSIDELIERIASLDTFITADSGPMHIASSFDVFGVKTIALFGATKDNETCPWSDKNSVIVKQDIESLKCMPCMQRKCKEVHHKCMKNIQSSDIINRINLLN